MKRLVFLLGMLFAGTFIAPLSPISADIPKLINYQGMLTDGSGTPLSGLHDIIFKIYNAELGGTQKWAETQSSVSVANGLFNVTLGSSNPIDLDFDEDYWLEITVDGETMPDRLKFTSVGYAYRAQRADTATVALSASASNGWVDDGGTVRLETGTDSVGIGTSHPKARLEINGQNSEAGFRAAWGGSYPLLYGEFKHTGSGGLKINANAGGGWADMSLQTEGTTRLFIESAGKVGIGTSSPNSSLDVAGSMAVMYRYVVSDQNVMDYDCVIAVNASGGARHLYLPSAVGTAGRVYTVKKVDSSSNSVFVEASAGQHVDGYSYVVLAEQWNSVTVVSDGSNWLIISRLS
jgi:hypothetical protein